MVRHLAGMAFLPLQYGQPVWPLVLLPTVASHSWPNWHFHQTFLLLPAVTFSVPDAILRRMPLGGGFGVCVRKRLFRISGVSMLIGHTPPPGVVKGASKPAEVA